MISCPLSDYIKHFFSDISPRLVGVAYRDKISALSQWFPSRITSVCGLEIHLEDESARADYAFQIAHRATHHDGLAQMGRIWTGEPGKRLLEFYNQWQTSDTPFYPPLDHIWLEFDIDPVVSTFSLPSVFFCLRPFVPKIDNRQTIKEIADGLQGKDFTARLLPTLQNCFSTLPEFGRINLFGIMLSRDLTALRLSVEGLNSEQIVEYLQRLSWRGDHSLLTETLALPGETQPQFLLNLDVGVELGSRISLECRFKEGKISSRPYPWFNFLQALVEKRMCPPEKGQALIEYSGIVNQANKPANLRDMEEFLGNVGQFHCIRKISHFKLVLEPNRRLSAKAYLEASLYWVGR